MQVVSLVTRNEGDYVVHATASVYGGGSAVASPASKDGQVRYRVAAVRTQVQDVLPALQASSQRRISQVHDLQEALNEKELELMELKQQHAQLQVLSNSHTHMLCTGAPTQTVDSVLHYEGDLYVGFIDFLFAL